MKVDTNTAYGMGHDAGLSALDSLGHTFDDKKNEKHLKDAMAGLMCSVFECCYAMAGEKAANELISLAQKFAWENVNKEGE